MNSDQILETNRVVLFTDVHNFSIAAKILAKRQHKFIQEMYETLGEIVVNHEGKLVKYLGDGFLCTFPIGLEQKAVACAVEMRATFSEMVKKWELPTDTELEVGIDAGKVVEGVFGHRTLKLRDIYGEVVNRAAMIGHHRGVAITEPINKSVMDQYATRPLPDVVLKWQDEHLKVWELE